MDENLRNTILEKLIPFQNNIKDLEISLQRKNDELIILTYAYCSIKKELEKLHSKKNLSIPLYTFPLFITPKPNMVNIYLKQINAARIFNYVEISSLINLRQVCKIWDSEICKFLLEYYKDSLVNKKEYKEKLIEEINPIMDDFRNSILRMNKDGLNEIKKLNSLPLFLNEFLIVVFMSLGINLSNEEIAAKNIFANQIKDISGFFNQIMVNFRSKHYSISYLNNLQKYMKDHPNITLENIAAFNISLKEIFFVLLNKIQYEELLIKSLDYDRVLIYDGAEYFFGEVIKNRLK